MLVMGIDEVGRGSWAGPLVVGAVILNKKIYKLKDSKILTKNQRLILARKVYKNCLAASLGWVWPEEIDEYGLSKSQTIAAKRAISQIKADYNEIIIDGKFNYLSELNNTKTLVRADALIPEVSAASIIAKVARDNYMTLIDSYYANYGFRYNVGYGTLLHRRSLKAYGPSPIHRLSFKPLKNLKVGCY